MSKQLLQKLFSEVKSTHYTWSLYFYRVDRRAHNPYKMHKVRFKQPQYLINYLQHLLSVVSSLQIAKISQIQDYDGLNTKTSCDKLDVSNDLISDQWEHFHHAVAHASDEEMSKGVHGYIVVGQPPTNSACPPLIMAKAANPVLKFSNKRSIVYKNTEKDELDLITDTIYRLYLTTDFIVCGKQLYTFNHKFETIFDIEKTLAKVKENAAEKIIETNCVSNTEAFQEFISQYTAPRTFITLNEDRLKRATQASGREHISRILGIPLDNNKNLIVSDMEEASLLIRYLCYKIFEESETKDVLEASTVIKIQP